MIKDFHKLTKVQFFGLFSLGGSASLCFLMLTSLLLSTLLCSNLEGKESSNPIIALWLTWEGDPTTTMTVRWVSSKDTTEDQIEYWESVPYREKPKNIYNAVATHYALPKKNYLLHEVTLSKLKQNHKYTFRLRHKKKEFSFKTMPQSLDNPIEFIVGGDLFQSKSRFAKIARIASEENPRFILFGGDLAYATGGKQKVEDFNRWLEWITTCYETLIDKNGLCIPMLATLGNHDTNGSYNQTPDGAPLFRASFPFVGNQGYNSLAFSNYLMIFLLNSGHTAPVEGAQTAWLQNALATSTHFNHRFAIYHVPAYPCAYSVNGSHKSRSIRKHWVPLFEEFNLCAAFENHEHLYKRTHPLREGQRNPHGVVYIGDGCFGTSPRKPRYTTPQLFAVAYPYVHFIKVRLTKDKRSYEAISEYGRPFDTFEQETR